MVLKVLPVVLVIAYPLLVHASVMLHAPRLALLALILLVCVGLFRPLAAARLWAWLSLLAISGLLFALMRTAGGIYAVYLPSLVMPAVLACVFGGSLRCGRQPLNEGVARTSRGGSLPDELVAYTRRLTQLWTLVFVAMFVAALALIVLQQRELWSLLTNVINYLLIAALVVCEYAFRRWRFPAHEHAGLIEHIRTVARRRRSGP